MVCGFGKDSRIYAYGQRLFSDETGMLPFNDEFPTKEALNYSIKGIIGDAK